MMSWHRMITIGILFICTGYIQQALARGSLGGADPPWNVEHISRLPREVREAIVRICGQSAQAAHYFATYSQHSTSINLHFEHLNCPAGKALCTATGCLHQTYQLNGSHYRLLRSYYGPGND